MNLINKITTFANEAEIFDLDHTLDMLDEEYQETATAIAAKDHEEIIDGFADIAFLAINGIYKEYCLLNYTHDEAVNAVIASMDKVATANLSKRFTAEEAGDFIAANFGATSQISASEPKLVWVRNHKGKIQKSSGFVAPKHLTEEK